MENAPYNILVGIDFGTTNTLISKCINNKIEIIHDGINNIIPSKIGIDKSNIYCGNYIPSYVTDIIDNFKLKIDKCIDFNSDDKSEAFAINKSKGFVDDEHSPSLTNFISNYNLSIYDLLVIFFSHLYYIIKKSVNIPTKKHILLSNKIQNDLLNSDKHKNKTGLVTEYKLFMCDLESLNKTYESMIKCVITVPSDFNDIQRKIIKTALEYVGFEIIRIINEPSSAAIAYGLNYSSKKEEKILVIDIGGGTTDVTILQKTDLFFEVIHSEGLNDFGGNNITQLILDDFTNTHNLSITNQELKNKLWSFSQKIKEKLSYLDLYSIKLSNIFCNDIIYSLSKFKFELLLDPILIKFKKLLNNLVQKYPDINYTILVGGTNKISYIQNIIKKIFHYVWIYPNVEYAIVEGAGIYVGLLENKFKNSEDIILVDVTSSSLGVELMDGTYSIIIPKNTPLPAKRNQKYTTNMSCDNNITIKIFQGENKIASKNILIKELVFNKISLGGIPIITIEFKIDLNSIIYIRIEDKKSGYEKNYIIKDYLCNKPINFTHLNDKLNSEESEIEADEIIKIKLLYQINSFIENIIMNFQTLVSNHFFSSENSLENNTKFINELNSIEANINTNINNLNNLELLEIYNSLKEKYLMLGSFNPYRDECSLSSETRQDSIVMEYSNFSNELELQ